MKSHSLHIVVKSQIGTRWLSSCAGTVVLVLASVAAATDTAEGPVQVGTCGHDATQPEIGNENGSADPSVKDGDIIADLSLEELMQVQVIVTATRREQKIQAQRIRCHGYYHLRQVLFTGHDFAIIDFEGEPRRRLSERRLKNSPLRDVASMLHSFHYAASFCLLNRSAEVVVGHDEFAWLPPAVLFWESWVSATFLRAYLDVARTGGLIPESRQELDLLLRVYLLDRAISQLSFDLEHRPEWLRTPLDGIVRLLENRG